MKRAIFCLWFGWAVGWARAGNPLDPLGQTHIPIGEPNAVDALKTFVEAEGNFSPGVGSYGVYFWAWAAEGNRTWAPTMPESACVHGLEDGYLLIPWSRWRAGPVTITTRVAQAAPLVDGQKIHLAAAQVSISNNTAKPQRLLFYAALRPVGAAGGPVRSLKVNRSNMLAVEGQPALVSELPAEKGAVSETDDIGGWIDTQRMPNKTVATSETGDCAGALRFTVTLLPKQAKDLKFLCPVHPGRKVNGHRWDGVSTWAQLDTNAPYASDGQYQQPALDAAFFERHPELGADRVFAQARDQWRKWTEGIELDLPDARWAEVFRAILSHSAMNMNEGAPDVAVVNYNVFNRDGMYLANVFQKSGQFALAATAIDYFLHHPFNGRVQPEADNPGQILWIVGEHWRFTRDRAWLRRVYPSVQKLAALITYCRTTPGPHWVSDTGLEFGDKLPMETRKELKPGACNGSNPAYTDAYDVAGLRAASALAEESGLEVDHAAWSILATRLTGEYATAHGQDFGQGYGSYCVLWPCRLFPFTEGAAHDRFTTFGAQKPTSWRYFPLARAHQGLLAGNRAAGWETLQLHLEHPQMQGWYAFDEGGPSGLGSWNQLRTRIPIVPVGTNVQGTMAMPHGWANAELHLLLRDSLAYEDQEQLVLLAGIPEAWFKQSIRLKNLPTHFGRLDFECDGQRRLVRYSLERAPSGGVRLKFPPGFARGARHLKDWYKLEPDGSVILKLGEKGGCQVE